MRRAACLVVGLAIVSMWAMTPGLADGGTGGMFVDVPTTHSAYNAIRDLVSRGIIVIGAGGEFSGNAPLLRYDAAEWLYRAIRNVEGTRIGTDYGPQVASLETRVSSLDATVSREIQALKVQLAQVGQSATGETAQKAQTAFVLGVTGIVLALAAVALALWF
ncbi:S-layer homology domain-containing protein [Candidatus Bipolaricaulota bacterium]|nr:S-layer homology domain-containing protein [Candidatus Bipolaricaulota bacterium]